MKFITLTIALIVCSCSCIAQSWKELNNEVFALYDKGEHEKAFSIAEKAIESANKEFGKEHSSYASSLYNPGKLNEDLGRYSAVEGYYMPFLEIRKKIAGENHSGFARTCNALGVLYTNMKQLKLTYFKIDLKICSR